MTPCELTESIHRRREGRRQEQKNELIQDYMLYAAMFVKRGGDIRVTALSHTLKTKGRDEICNMISILVDEHLRPLLCQVLGTPLDTWRTVDKLDELIDIMREGQTSANW